jgi:hypothetical protein
MSEKISKISVDGVVYDIASTGGGEVPGDIQEQLSALENKVTEEASAREEGDAKLSEKIESEASRVDGMVNQINENVASSIETLNNNLVQAIETINNGIAAEVTNREEGDAKLQAAIDELAEKVNGEGADLTELEGKIEKNAADIATVNNNLVEAVNNINKNVADGFSTINGGLNNEIRPELEKAVKYEDTATEQNPGRKTIFLNNHDNICGKTTDGSAVNIAMVSKWNKVDLGSSSVEINLNGSAERPTYNDSKQIALLEDVHGNMETIALVKKDDLTYELQVGDKIAGTINIPADQFLKSVEYSAEDKSLTFVFNTSEGEQTSVVDLSSLVDTYVAGNGIELIENGFSIKLDPSSESYLSVSEAGIKVEGINEIKKNVQEVAANLVTVNENLASSIDAINKKAVKYEDVADSNLPERKAIVLKNGDVILGGNLEGGTSSLVQLNRWGVADFGSSSVPFNINTPKDVRPTVQEAGQSGEEAHKIAYLSDVESSSAQIEEVKAALETKADKADVDSAVENINSALDQKADKIAVDAITEQLATKADAESVDNRFATVNEGLDSKADKIAVDAITEKVDGISADLEGVVKYQEFGEGRKTIQLSNYDNISGIDTKGEGHNLVMLSKWDKADFGAPGVELNLNGSADRPTYNDTKEIALTEDIEAAKEGLISYKVLEDGSKTIELANGDSLSGVNAEGVAGFNLAKVTPENKVEIGSAGMDLNLVGSEPRPLFNGSKGIALSEDLETKAAELQDNINLKASQSDLEAYMSATDTKVSELEEKIGNVPTKVSELENDLGFQNEAQVDGKIKEAIDAIPEVDLEPYATKEEVTESSNEVLTNILGRIWTNTDKEESGNFDTSYKHADGSYARIWNETDGGGSQYYNSNKDTLSFVGVNDGNDGIHVQIYSKKKSTNVGARLNATPDGIFYGVGNSASIAPENELVVKKDITEVNTNLEAEIEARSTADTQLQNDLQVEATTAREAEKANADAIVAEVSRATEKEAEIEANLASAVKFTTSTYEGRDKKVITLDNDELINARSNSEDLENKVNVGGKSISLIQLNRWNVVDVGSPYTLTNINTPKGQRPTVQEAGQSGPEANQIAYVSDVAGLSNTLEALNATVQILQSKVDVLTKTNTEVVSVDGSAGELKDSSKDYIVSGSINENAEIVGKSISLKSIKVSDNARLKLNAGDVEAKDLNISGSFPKANGNTVISVNNAEFIVFKDMVFDASEVYNGIEIGLASNSVLPKNILFDNCKFQGEFSNNAILVFGTQDNAIITLNNCYFEKISNALRLSNKSNASGVVVNINNCTVDQWETRAPWQGFLICEDYTNKTEEEVNANNLFGDGKITVNFNNLVHAGVKINPADPASVCGTKNESQVVMVCQDAVAGPEGDYCLSYDAAKFPVVSFK